MTTRPDTLAREIIRQRARVEGREPAEAEVEAELAACRPERPAYMEETFRALDGIAAADRLHQAAQHAMEARIVAGVVEGLREPQERAPRRRRHQRKAGRFAEWGAEGAAVRKPDRDAEVDEAVRETVRLALKVRSKGLPAGEGRWSVDTLVYYLRDECDPQPGPKPPTLKEHLRKGVKGGLLPPIRSWNSKA